MRLAKIERNRANLASQAALCYNGDRNIDALAVLETPRAVHLVRRCTLDTIPSTSGIYKITCTTNKKFYIGSALNLRLRKRQHFNHLRQNKHENPKLQNAWNKYGEDAFIFEVLEQVLSITLTAREQYWLNLLKPFGHKGFNIAREAGSPMMGRKHTPETRENMSQSLRGNKYALGMKHTPEAKAKISQANLGMKQTPEHNEKLRQTNLGKKPSPQCIEAVKRANTGRKHTLETIEKHRQAALARKRVGGKFT
jgi:group I intron endonuclease